MSITISGTNQEIFNIVCWHLDAQGHQAMRDGVCQYRTESNGQVDRCAIGCLIPDDKYTPVIEGKTISQNTRHFNMNRDVGKHTFLTSLQRAHDAVGLSGKNWSNIKGRLRNVAITYNLDSTVLESLKFIPH